MLSLSDGLRQMKHLSQAERLSCQDLLTSATRSPKITDSVTDSFHQNHHFDDMLMMF